MNIINTLMVSVGYWRTWKITSPSVRLCFGMCFFNHALSHGKSRVMGITHADLVLVDIYLFDSFFTCHRGETNTLMCVYKHGSSTSPCSSLSRMSEIYGWSRKKPDQYPDFHTKQASSHGYPSRSQWKLQYINILP